MASGGVTWVEGAGLEGGGRVYIATWVDSGGASRLTTNMSCMCVACI